MFHEEQMGVNTRHYALSGRLFVTCSTIHLTGQKEVRNHFGAQRIVKILGIEIIVFNSIGRLEENSIL